jgi:hypothetical protein
VKHTVIAVFDKAEDVQKVAQALKARGFDEAAIHVARGGDAADDELIAPALTIESGPLTGLLHRLSVLFGAEEVHLAHYEEAVRRGSRVLEVDAADEAQAATARDTLLAQGAVNIEDRVEEWQRAGWRSPAVGAQAAAAGSAGAVVHRQEVSLGGVRVYGRVVVSTFDDIVDDFRSDYQSRYAATGSTYEDFDPAYRYGHALASDSRYRGRSWDEIETEARAEWEQRHPRSAWERFKSAVRHAWARTTGE